MARKDDIVSDIMERIEGSLRALGAVPEAVILTLRQRVEREVRQTYGGSECYVLKDADRDTRQRQAVAEVSRGVPVPVAGARHGVSRSTLYDLLKRK